MVKVDTPDEVKSVFQLRKYHGRAEKNQRNAYNGCNNTGRSRIRPFHYRPYHNCRFISDVQTYVLDKLSFGDLISEYRANNPECYRQKRPKRKNDVESKRRADYIGTLPSPLSESGNGEEFYFVQEFHGGIIDKRLIIVNGYSCRTHQEGVCNTPLQRRPAPFLMESPLRLYKALFIF